MGLRENSLDHRENRWAPDGWIPGKDPLFTFYHDQLLLVDFNHSYFTVLENSLSEAKLIVHVTNLIIDA